MLAERLKVVMGNVIGETRDGNLPEPDGEPGSSDPDGDGENPENRGRGPGPGIPGIAKPGPGKGIPAPNPPRYHP